MKKNRFVPLIALALTLCMLLSVFVACDGGDPTPDATSEGTGVKETVPTGRPTDAEGYVLDALPEDLKLNREFSILGVQEQKAQYYAEANATAVIPKVLFKRAETVQARLNTEFKWTFVNGDWEDRAAFCKEVQATSTTSAAYDAVICYNLVPYVLATNGLAENLYGTKYIDLTAPWWPSAYTAEALYNNTIYGLVENCAYGTLRQMTGVFFNNDLIDSHGMESPYDMVANDTWTFDNMMAMLKDTYKDLNNNGQKDSSDYFGVCTGTSPKIDSWFYGMGYRWSDFDGDGNLQLLAGEASVLEFSERLAAAFQDQSFYPVDSKHAKMFTEVRAIMYMTSVVLADSYLHKLELNYGIVPNPKGSDQQENYITHLSNTHEAWCLPLNVDSIDESSAVLECLASESYRQVDPTYYESCIKLRYAPDERLADMYDLIRDSITFDFFYLFAGSFSANPLALLRSCCQNPTANSWSQKWAANGANFEAELEKIIALYTAN